MDRTDRTNIITFSHSSFTIIIIKEILKSHLGQFYFQIEFESIQVTCFVFSSSGCQRSNVEAGFDFFKYGKFVFFFFLLISSVPLQ